MWKLRAVPWSALLDAPYLEDLNDPCSNLSQPFGAAPGVFSNVVDFDFPLGLLNVIWLNFREDSLIRLKADKAVGEV